MAKVVLQCPSCGKEVELGEIECKYCGVNLKSGEAYESKVKKGKSKDKHPEHFGAGILLGVAVAFALVTFSGYMYQKLVRETFVQKPDLFKYPVLRMRELGDMVRAGDVLLSQGELKRAKAKYEEARDATQELVKWLQTEADRIKPEEPYKKQQESRYAWRQAQNYNKRVAKRQLANLKLKAERFLETIPSV